MEDVRDKVNVTVTDPVCRLKWSTSSPPIKLDETIFPHKWYMALHQAQTTAASQRNLMKITDKRAIDLVPIDPDGVAIVLQGSNSLGETFRIHTLRDAHLVTLTEEKRSLGDKKCIAVEPNEIVLGEIMILSPKWCPHLTDVTYGLPIARLSGADTTSEVVGGEDPGRTTRNCGKQMNNRSITDKTTMLNGDHYPEHRAGDRLAPGQAIHQQLNGVADQRAVGRWSRISLLGRHRWVNIGTIQKNKEDMKGMKAAPWTYIGPSIRAIGILLMADSSRCCVAFLFVCFVNVFVFPTLTPNFIILYIRGLCVMEYIKLKGHARGDNANSRGGRRYRLAMNPKAITGDSWGGVHVTMYRQPHVTPLRGQAEGWVGWYCAGGHGEGVVGQNVGTRRARESVPAVPRRGGADERDAYGKATGEQRLSSSRLSSVQEDSGIEEWMVEDGDERSLSISAGDHWLSGWIGSRGSSVESSGTMAIDALNPNQHATSEALLQKQSIWHLSGSGTVTGPVRGPRPSGLLEEAQMDGAFERLTALRERLTSPSPQPAPSAPLAPATSDVEKVVASVTGTTEALGSTLAEGTRKVLKEVQAGSAAAQSGMEEVRGTVEEATSTMKSAARLAKRAAAQQADAIRSAGQEVAGSLDAVSSGVRQLRREVRGLSTSVEEGVRTLIGHSQASTSLELAETRTALTKAVAHSAKAQSAELSAALSATMTQVEGSLQVVAATTKDGTARVRQDPCRAGAQLDASIRQVGEQAQKSSREVVHAVRAVGAEVVSATGHFMGQLLDSRIEQIEESHRAALTTISGFLQHVEQQVASVVAVRHEQDTVALPRDLLHTLLQQQAGIARQLTRLQQRVMQATRPAPMQHLLLDAPQELTALQELPAPSPSRPRVEEIVDTMEVETVPPGPPAQLRILSHNIGTTSKATRPAKVALYEELLSANRPHVIALQETHGMDEMNPFLSDAGYVCVTAHAPTPSVGGVALLIDPKEVSFSPLEVDRSALPPWMDICACFVSLNNHASSSFIGVACAYYPPMSPAIESNPPDAILSALDWSVANNRDPTYPAAAPTTTPDIILHDRFLEVEYRVVTLWPAPGTVPATKSIVTPLCDFAAYADDLTLLSGKGAQAAKTPQSANEAQAEKPGGQIPSAVHLHLMLSTSCGQESSAAEEGPSSLPLPPPPSETTT
eukprot:gene7794-5445_t